MKNRKHPYFRDNRYYYGSGRVHRKHADFPQRGNPAPIRASLSSPEERSRARSALLGFSQHPT